MKITLGPVLLMSTILLAVAGVPDDDGDGVPNDEDCRPNDPNVWAAPAAGVTDLQLGRAPATATLEWSRPAALGCVPGVERYDALASRDAEVFGYPLGFCASINGSGLSASDERALPPGETAFYLVRVENECGVGPLDGDPPPAVPRSAQYLEVTNLDDSGPGSLRGAIASAAGGEAICFEPTGTIALASTLTVNKLVAIAGPGADLLTIDGGGAPSVLTLNVRVSISDVTVSGGDIGLDVEHPVVITSDKIQGNGTGIYLGEYSYDAMITTTTVQGNDVGIHLDGYYAEPVISSSTIKSNGTGVALYGYYNGVFMSSNTIADNEIGVLVHSVGPNFIYHNTIANNERGLQLHTTAVTFNTIVSNPVDCDGPASLMSAGNNLITDPLCGAPQDLHADALLGPLGQHGGPTETFSLLPGSPAIDGGFCPPSGAFGAVADQRGLPRPVGQPELPDLVNGCDIGAYEVQGEFACDCESDDDCTAPDSCYAGCVCRYVPVCGNGICDFDEDALTCVADCPAVCGNGIVEPGEECEAATDCPQCHIGEIRECTDCACGCVPFP